MLSKVTIKGTRFIKDSHGIDVLEVDEQHALVKAAGYLKFKMAKESGNGIFFRGQHKIYSSLVPTLYRSISLKESQHRWHEKLSNSIISFRNKANIFSGFAEFSHEPLLQHYGIRTTWVDIVDNVWVALWFACHNALTIGKNNEFMHFERRVPDGNDDFAYILLISTDLRCRARDVPGYYFGNTTELIDLRMAAPSIFLRPHAQHGMLFRSRGKEGGRTIDYKEHICGTLRIDLSKALDWLGSGKMTNTHSLFPPPYYDDGYKILLTCGAEFDPSIGAIHHVGA